MNILNQALEQILQISENAPELNMSNYSLSQVRDLNNANIEIYQIVKSVLAKNVESVCENCHKLKEEVEHLQEILYKIENANEGEQP